MYNLAAQPGGSIMTELDRRQLLTGAAGLGAAAALAPL